ncbi:DUF4278 domain-containing protein [Leptothermofonsia sichuanensis E412]|uniref:DUF4278 domain-containing protein n=1 Tax=Leptothermofonsia sichuanensis TaxID=2917832 RepID=UPI001CA7301A|nr:DUF4278 domain-containing protein [Leptothermofonsia sichuanensis]QZZ21199.1 DUF4278 domain-containing protein [Leptothermofonsia sichuanensis E412]
MRLKYRGNDYEYAPRAIETVESPATGQYRGVAAALSSRKKVPVPQSVVTMRYRGIDYIELR